MLRRKERQKLLDVGGKEIGIHNGTGDDKVALAENEVQVVILPHVPPNLVAFLGADFLLLQSPSHHHQVLEEKRALDLMDQLPQHFSHELAVLFGVVLEKT